MKHRFVPRRPFLLLALIAVAWLLLPGFFKTGLRSGFYEFQAPAWVARAYLEDLRDYWLLRGRSRHELIEAGRDMARLNAAYELRLQREATITAELRSMERLLGLDPSTDYHYVVARVIRRDHNAWWQQLVIRKGENEGIREGMAVVSADGVVGRIREVATYTAVVELVSSPGFRMAAHVAGDFRPITYQGGVNIPFRSPTGRISNVPADLRVGDSVTPRLVSSRLGGVFPDGLTIGSIQQLEPSPDGLFQTGSVQLPETLLSVREVAVLVPIHEIQTGETGTN